MEGADHNDRWVHADGAAHGPRDAHRRADRRAGGVIGSNGKLAGYAGGPKRKQKLLDLEHAKVTRVLAPTLW
jgi:hypothetical protein